MSLSLDNGPSITSLPGELITEIGKRLEKVDLLSCNLVCRFWRNSLNLNELWYRFCFEDYGLEKSESPVLSQCHSRVSTDFPPADGLDSLVAICPWRLRYMQEVRISQNWKNGCFVPQVWAEDNEHGSLLKRMEHCDILCDGYNVITYHFLIHCFKVWDVQTMEYKEEISYSSNIDYVKYYCLIDGTFIFVQSYMAKVYKRNKERFFDLKLEFNLEVSTKNPLMEVWFFCHNKNYFVASFIENIGRSRSTILIVYNLQTGSKHVEEIFSYNVISQVTLQITSTGDLFIGLDCMHQVLESYYYNFTTKKFSPKLVIQCPILVNEWHIIHLDIAKLITLWHHNGQCKVLKQVHSDENLEDLLTAKECYPYVVFVIMKHDKMRILHLETGKETNVSTGETIYSVSIIRPNMALLRFWKYDSFMDLWDLSTCLKLCRIQASHVAVVTPCRTKLLALANKEKLMVLHFW